METTTNIISPIVFNDNQKQQIESLLHGLSEKQVIWLAGYLTGIGQSDGFIKSGTTPVNGNTQINTPPTVTVTSDLTIIYGSRTGNGEYIAKKLKAQAESKGFQVHIHDMGDYPLQKLQNEKNLLIIVSTHGEGVPPVAAEDFYEFLHGKRVKPFENSRFSVLALGDKSYVHFCKTGKDVDLKLEELGGKRIYPRADCDVDFHAVSDEWINGVISAFLNAPDVASSIKINGNGHLNGQASEKVEIYNRQSPYKARVLEKFKLNGKGSTKEVYHYELSIDKSGIKYQPGDAVGIYASNPEKLVYELTEALHLNPGEPIEYDNSQTTLGDVLTRRFEISNLNQDIITSYNQFAQSKKLTEILSDSKALGKYAYDNDLVDMATEFPIKISATELTGILRKIQPRLYSIASSQKAFAEEIHLTVSALRYVNSRLKDGVCSTYLSDRLGEKEAVLLYHERNPDFRLPENTDAPIIMVGPGTGIAPFRAFLQEREALDAKGKNWLFFGDRQFTTDFLYQTELLAWHKKGILNNLNVAFSRDSDQKVYVQHKMLEHSKELINWLEEGAYFYICGDANNMGNDVYKTLTNIIVKEKKLSLVKAEEYIKAMKKAKRYQTDVY